MDIEVRSNEGHELHVLVYQIKRLGLIAELYYGNSKLRSMHTHGGHRNPRSIEREMENGHVHFPTKRYPLVRSQSTYAYEIDFDVEDRIDFLFMFCELMNIDIDSVQLSLESGGRR